MSKPIFVAAMLMALCSCSGAERPAQEVENSVGDVAIEANATGSAVENAVDAVDNSVESAENAASGFNESANAANVVESSNTDQWCAAARATMAVSQCQSLTTQRDALEDGVSAFNPPRKMTLDHPTQVVLAIGAKADEMEIRAAAGGQSTSTTRVAPVRIGRYMTATLTGSAFTITPVGNPERDLGMSTSEQWEWTVTPKDKGDQALQVRVETFAQDASGHRTRIKLYQSPPVSVAVDVTSLQDQLEKNNDRKERVNSWTDLLKSINGGLVALAGVLAAAALVIWRLRGFGKKPEKDTDADTNADVGTSPSPDPTTDE